MKIKKLTLDNFMAFGNAQIDWSDNINIICGENSTGKTTLLKVMYSLTKPLSNENRETLTKEMEEQLFVRKIQGIFRPDEMKIGRLVSRRQGSNRTDFSIDLEKEQRISVGFGNRQENHADVSVERGEKNGKYDAGRIWNTHPFITNKGLKADTSRFDTARTITISGKIKGLTKDQDWDSAYGDVSGIIQFW